MKRTGAWLAVRALEAIGVRNTFGIPGVHNTELYDELQQSGAIVPILVTHELGAAFAADAVSRLGDGKTLGTLALVPAAGLTHASSGIGEAMLAGIPMLVITGGVRRDTGRRFQLHEIDQLSIARALTKAAFRVERQADVVPTIFEAARIALSEEPGPVLVELPTEVLLFPGEAEPVPAWNAPQPPLFRDAAALSRAADLLLAARRPGIFVGWGGRGAAEDLAAIASLLDAPVATTLQGLSSFPHDHPLHAGFGFGPAAASVAREAFAQCDAMLAVGTRFAEIATGSYGVEVPSALVHVDINPAVFDANYRAAVPLLGDAARVIAALRGELEQRTPAPRPALQAERIRAGKAADRARWLAGGDATRVHPVRFFDELRRQIAPDALVTVDDGNHTYLTAELLPLPKGARLLVPTDFNAMGYAVPAAVGASIAQPEREVVAIVGDGALRMTGMEILTAVSHGLGICFFVFADGELAQIAQAQRIPYGRATCSTLGSLELESFARSVGAHWIRIENNAALEGSIRMARSLAAEGKAVLVEVAIDYSQPTAFTRGVVATNFRRFPLGQKVRMLARAVRRRWLGAS